jgi:very-short-patch-repair endonuclease
MARSSHTPRARSLRTTDNKAEARLWSALRNRQLGGWKWKRQVPRGRYIVDFLCAEALLVVELDGGQHTDQVAYDQIRTAYLTTVGLRVLRFWSNEALSNTRGVCDTILAACHQARAENPLPTRGERAG